MRVIDYGCDRSGVAFKGGAVTSNANGDVVDDYVWYSDGGDDDSDNCGNIYNSYSMVIMLVLAS